MPNRFIFSLRFSTKVFHRLTTLSLAMVFFMSLFRLNLYFLSVWQATPDVFLIEIGQSFLAGLRFDLMIFGFLMAPICFLLLAQAVFEKWPRGMFSLYGIYFSLSWTLICLLTFVDFFHFSRYGQRMRSADFVNWRFSFLAEQWALLSNYQAWFFCITTIILLGLGLTLVRSLKFGEWKDVYSPQPSSRFEVAWRVLLPLILTFLAARGTVGAHHLAIEHSEVSNIKSINEMALNAIWCFDK